MSKKLIVLAGPDEGREFVLGAEPILVGRSRATLIHLTDPHVSRVHCQVLPEGNQHVLVDFDSVSGTFVNGKEIDRHILQSADLVRIGATHMQFVVEADTEAASPGENLADRVGQGAGRADDFALRDLRAVSRRQDRIHLPCPGYAH